MQITTAATGTRPQPVRCHECPCRSPRPNLGHGLAEATKALLDWAAGQGLSWDMTPAEGGERWGARLEIYLTDPGQEPDMSKWHTQLAFRLAD